MANEFEFNEHSKDVERESNLTRAQARERLEAKRVADNKGKDYTISDNFPHNENEYKFEKQSKPEEIIELEDIFSLASDDAFNLADRFRHGELRTWKTGDLRDELKYLQGNEDEGVSGELRDMYEYNQGYLRLTGERDPNYDKYVAYMSVVSNKLDKEITLRNKISRGFED